MISQRNVLKSLLLSILLLLVSSQVFSQGTELNPGRLEGQVSFSSGPVSSFTVYASSTTDGFSSQGNFSGDSYSLLVEGDHSYRINLYAYLQNGGPTTYLQIYRSSTALATYVPVDGIGTADFNYAAHRIDGQVNVLGGQISSFDVWANANENGESYTGRIYLGSSAGGSFSLPMISDTLVSVSARVNMVTDAGAPVVQLLPAQQVDLSSADATVQWNVDLSDLVVGSLAGDAVLTASGDDSLVSYHYVYASGNGAFRTVYLSGNGSYEIPNLEPGRYSNYAYTRFAGPYGWFYHRNIPVDITAGSTAFRDFLGELGFIRGQLNVDGFLTTADITSGAIQHFSTPGSTGCCSGGDWLYSGGTFDIAVPAGEWVPYYFSFNAQDFSDPATPLNVQISGQDLSLYDPSRGGTPVSIAAGEDVTIPGFEITTVETEITLDVIEPAGEPEIGIRSAFVNGYGPNLDENGSSIGYKRFYAYGSNQEQPKPVVRIVGQPGTYSVTVDAYVGNSRPRFGTFSLTLEPFDTPVGPGVIVMPAEDVELEFENVIEPGITSVTEVPLGPEPAEGFKILSPGGVPIYYNISTTAVFEGLVKVCIDYDDTGLADNKEKNLKLFHYDAALARWDNITASSTAEEPNPDTVNNRLCGFTASFSTFAVMVPDNVLPEIESLTASLDPVEVDTPAFATVTFADPNEFDDHMAEWEWGDGSKTIESIPQGDRILETQHVYQTAGVYRISVAISDAFGDDSESFEFVVVYDPNGGFVTGGGFIQSPEGAYTSDPGLTGKASFGFVSKYKKGASVPSGQTQFQFKVADLDFHSTDYEWLVIAGARAQYKGTGTIDGSGDFGFMITAIDGQQNGGGGSDLFRIKIWNRSSGGVAYDNQPGASDGSDPITALSGGSIVIHSGG